MLGGDHLVHGQVAAVEILEPDLERKIVKQRTQVLFALAQFLFDAELARDVGRDTDHGHWTTRFVTHQGRLQLKSPGRTISLGVDDPAVPATLGLRCGSNFLLRGVRLRFITVVAEMFAQKSITVCIAPFKTGPIEVGDGAIEVGDGDLALDLVEHQRLQAHLFLALALLADVADHQAQLRLACRIRCRQGQERDPHRVAVALVQAQFAGLCIAAGQCLLAHPVEAVLVRRFNKGREALPDQCLALAAEQAGHGQIDLHDQALCAERAIAYWCQIVEIKEALPGAGQLDQCAAQFLVLYLKLDLV